MIASVFFRADVGHAFAEGEAPTQIADESIFGSAQSAGNTLMLFDGINDANFALLATGSDVNIDIPPGAEVIRAFLFWAGSLDPVFGVDQDVDFTLPDSTFINDLNIGIPQPGETLSMLNRCISRDDAGDVAMGFFSCRREVTSILQGLGTGGASGIYNLQDVDALPGNCTTNPSCQAAFAGWALVVIWEETASISVRSDVVLYDGFFGVDEQNIPNFDSGLSPFFSLSGFEVGEDAAVEIAFMGFEGDSQLGVPPQDHMDIDPGLFCPTCFDYIEVNGGAGTARLNGPVNPEGNLFNGSNNISGGTHAGVDIDSFDLGPTGLNVLQEGDTSLFLQVGSGDGIPDIGQGGSGELVFLGWVLLSTETFSPRLGFSSSKDVVQASAGPGDTLQYILRIENDGSDNASGIVVRETAMPAGTQYVTNSTTNTCGVNSGDMVGQSPLLGAGLNIGNLNIGQSCSVFYEVQINIAVPPGTLITNDFILSANNHPEVVIGTAQTSIIAPEIGTVTKEVSVLGGGLPAPGASLVYTITLPNAGAVALSGVQLTDMVPNGTTFSQMLALPPGSTDNSDIPNEIITIDDISIPVGSSEEVVFAVQIDNGTPIATVISNQATASSISLPAPVFSDDPSTGVVGDFTQVTVVSDSDIGTSSKTVQDVSGDPNQTIRGDTLEYSLVIEHSGMTNQTVFVVDDLPSFVEDCIITNAPALSFLNCVPGGANGTGQISGSVPVAAGGSETVTFTVNVANDAPDGEQIINEASLIPAADPGSGIVVTSGALEVFARPVFSNSTKSATVVGGGAVEPSATLRYEIIVRNDGVVDATNVVVTDVLADDLVFISSAPAATTMGNTVTFNIPTLAIGASTTLSIDAQISATATNGTEISNSATISADAPAQDFTTNVVNNTVIANADLSATKTFVNLTRNDGTHRPGDRIQYTLTLENNGNGAAINVEVRDPLFLNAFDTGSVVFPSGGHLEGSEVVFDSVDGSPNLLSFNPGFSESYIFTVQLLTPLTNGLEVSNQGSITAAEVVVPVLTDFPDTPAVIDDPTVFTITSLPDFQLQKSVRDEGGDPILPGETVSPGTIVEYFFQLENTGDAVASSLEVTDDLAGEVTFLSSSDGGILTGNSVTFNAASNPALFLSMAPGAPITFAFRVRLDSPLPDATLITNQATVIASGVAAVLSDDPNTAAPLDETVLEVQAGANLNGFSKAFATTDTDGNGEISPGDAVVYVLTITNTGNAAATNAIVADDLPVELTQIAASNGAQVVGNTVTWNGATTPALQSVEPSETIVLTVNAEIVRPIANNTLISNQASLSADGIAPVASDFPDTVDVDDATPFTVVSHPLLLVRKSVTPAAGFPVAPGDSLTYTIEVENTGGRAATGVSIIDAVSPQLENVNPQNNGVFAGGTITWDQGSVPALSSINVDTTVTVSFTAQSISPLANGTVISNQAVVSISEGGIPGAPFSSDDPNTPQVGDTTDVQIVSASNLSASTLESFDTMDVVIDSTSPGSTIRYVLIVRNQNSMDDADNVTVTIDVPATVLSISNAPGGTIMGNTITYNSVGVPQLATVSPGDAIQLTFETQVVSPLADGTPILLQAQLDADDVTTPFSSDDPSTAAFGDATLVTVQSSADLSGLQKTFLDIDGSDDGNIVEPGDFVQYTIRVINTGDGAATNVVVRDPLPVGVTFATSSTGGNLFGNEVIFDRNAIALLQSVEPGASAIELRFTVQINDDVAHNALVQNQAFVTADNSPESPSDDPLTPAGPDSTDFSVQRLPGMTFTKDLTSSTSPNDRILRSGDLVLYTFVVASTGTGDLAASTFTDALPENLINVTTMGGVSYDEPTRALAAAISGLPSGEQVTFSVAAEVAPGTANGTTLENQAQINSPDLGIVLSDDPQTGQDIDATIALINALAELSSSTKIAVDENGDTLVPGDVIRYVITVQNTGSGDAEQVQVTDVVDITNLEILEAENDGVVAGNTIIWESSANAALVNVAGATSVELAFRARVRGEVENGTEIFNQGSITAQGLGDAILTDDPATPAILGDATRVLVLAPTLVFLKSFSDLTGDDILRPGDQVRYQISLQNGGTAASTNTTITDVLPFYLQNAQAVSGVIVDGVATWDLGDVPPGDFVDVELLGQVDELAIGGSELSNQAELINDEFTIGIPSDDPSTPEADATQRVIEAEEDYEGSIALIDADTDLPIVSAVVPGQRILVRARFQNIGSQAGQAVALRIPFNAAQFVLEEAGSGGIVSDNEMRWDASQLMALQVVRPGDEVTVEAIGTIQAPIPNGVSIDVRGIISSGVSPGIEWVVGPASLLVESQPSLSVSTKEVQDENGGVVEPGDVLTYRITVINDGGAEAGAVVITEPIPAGTAYVPGSTAIAGVPIADEDAFPFSNGLEVGDVSSGRSLVVSFQVRVHIQTLRGTRIDAQATLEGTNTATFVTDNPATPLILGDPTSVIVGGGPVVQAHKTASAASIPSGGTIRFQIAIENSGTEAALDLAISDEIPIPGQYVPGSIQVDGTPVTDANDGDAAVFIDGATPRLEMRRDVLEAGQGMLIDFDVQALDGPRIVNQAAVEYNGSFHLLSDADPLLPGAQQVVVPVEGGRALLVDENTSILTDGNGDILEPTDPIQGRTLVKNRSLESIRINALEINIGSLVDFDESTLEETLFSWDESTRVLRLDDDESIILDSNEIFSIQYQGTVVAEAEMGEVVRAVATAEVETLDGAISQSLQLGEPELTVGLMPGTGALSGTVFYDEGERNETYDPERDRRATGFQILAFLEGANDEEPVRTAVSDNRGQYSLSLLPSGSYRMEIRSESGAVYRKTPLSELDSGEIRQEDLRIDPSGVVYNSRSFRSLPGARVFLYVDDGDANLENDELVPEEDLLPGQQGQLSTDQGLYRFDPFPGEYRIGIEPLDLLYGFPSQRIAPERSGGDNHPLGAVAVPDENGFIVAHSRPDKDEVTTYYLRFSLATDQPPVLNNHIPMDSIRDQITILKTSNRKKVSMGDLLAYTVRVDNRSGGEISSSDGGVEIVDTLPQGFSLVKDSWRLVRIETDVNGQQQRTTETSVGVEGKRTLRFGSFALLPNSSYELRYQLVVGPGVRFGLAENRAALRLADGQVPLSATATASVRVVPDPLFDLGSLRAKVYCDENEDHFQDRGEDGIPGARVYLDTGYFADADFSGKLHFTGIIPGMHLAKLDRRTLPPGAEPVEDVRKSFYISSGLPAQVDFPVRCQRTWIGQPTVKINEDAYRPPPPNPPIQYEMNIAGDLRSGEVYLGATLVQSPTLRLGLAKEGSEMVFGGAGPNFVGMDQNGLQNRLVLAPIVKSTHRILAWRISVQEEIGELPEPLSLPRDDEVLEAPGVPTAPLRGADGGSGLR